MSARRKPVRLQQLHLFRPQPPAPRWQDLSPEIQRASLLLLARLLRATYHSLLPAGRGKEAGDE